MLILAMKQQIPIYSFSFDPTGKGTNPRYASRSEHKNNFTTEAVLGKNDESRTTEVLT
jgi:hypothetical protein